MLSRKRGRRATTTHYYDDSFLTLSPRHTCLCVIMTSILVHCSTIKLISAGQCCDLSILLRVENIQKTNNCFQLTIGITDLLIKHYKNIYQNQGVVSIQAILFIADHYRQWSNECQSTEAKSAKRPPYQNFSFVLFLLLYVVCLTYHGIF